MFLKFLDSAKAWQTGFQDPATPLMEGIIDFHNHILFFLIIIAFLVGWLMFRVVQLYNSDAPKPSSNFSHSTFLEVAWTVLPALILMVIAVPSFALLYSLDEVIDPFFTLKVTGAQWYWHYEYSDWVVNDGEEDQDISFDSYMLATDDLQEGQLRLLDVDNRVILPINTHIRVLVTAQDVLHSWSVPSFGVKVDACPGRLNQASIFIKRAGTYYGQCQEICGVRHGFMPIVIDAVNLTDYVDWLSAKLSLSEDD
jgi:cytochrome c oxidase subunit 2